MKPEENSRMFEIQDLAVGYSGKTVLEHISLNLSRGRFISLLGPNGAGKTTLLRTLARLLEPVAGTVLLHNRRLEDYRQEELAKLQAVVLTDKVSPGLFTVFDFVSQGRYPHTGFLGMLKDRDKEAVNEALAQVNAVDFAFRPLDQLSDGERQKIMLARALAQEPRVILLDEPTMHLDLKHRMEVMNILQRLCREKKITVVASLHDVDIAAKVSDFVALIKDRAITAWGPPEQVLQEETVSSLYDFEGACFNRWLGSIEIKGNGRRGRVFVVAGMGSGAVLYRLLAKRGFAIATGALHLNDLDYFVARTLGSECIAAAPAAGFSDDVLRQAEASIDSARCVIDAGFPVGPLNQENLKLFDHAAAGGKTIFSLRPEGAAELSRHGLNGAVQPCLDETDLLNHLEHYWKN